MGREGDARSAPEVGDAPRSAPGDHLGELLPQPAPRPGALPTTTATATTSATSSAAAHGRTRRRADERALAAGGTSVGARLTRALGVVVALLLLVGISGAGGLLVTGSSRARETQLRQLESANASLGLTLADAESSPGEGHDRALAALPRLRSHVRELLTDPLQRSLFTEQSRLIDAWLTSAGDPAQDPEQAQRFADLREANARLDLLVRHQRDEATSAESRARTGALIGTVLTLAAALAVVVSTGARTRRALLDPLRALVDVLDALHHVAPDRGDQRAHADPTSGPSEVRTVALAVNDLARENQRLLDAAERSARLHRLAGDIGREVRDQLVAQDALQVAVTRLGEELDVARVWVRMLQDEGADAGLGPIAREWARPPLPLLRHGSDPVSGGTSAFDDSRSWIYELHASGEVYAVPDTRALRGRSQALDGFLRASDARALLLVPIGVGDVPHGLLTLVCSSGPREWSVQEVDLARSVAVDLARALVLAGLYRAQERLLGELRDVESVKSDLLATVSHELRTPLTSIAGYLELLRDGAVGEVSEDVAAVLGIVERNTERLRALIEDLLLLSRVESAPDAEVRGSTAISDLVAGVALAVGAGATSGGTLRCTTPVEDLAGLRVPGDAEHLHRAVLAVVDNAVKFSPAGSLVRLRVEQHSGRVRIVVQDNGMGIPSGEVGAVFGRFARGSNAAALAVPGTGLGLTIARDLIRLHGGTIALDSVEGQGTTAVVDLPLLDAFEDLRIGGGR